MYSWLVDEDRSVLGWIIDVDEEVLVELLPEGGVVVPDVKKGRTEMEVEFVDH